VPLGKTTEAIDLYTQLTPQVPCNYAVFLKDLEYYSKRHAKTVRDFTNTSCGSSNGNILQGTDRFCMTDTFKSTWLDGDTGKYRQDADTERTITPAPLK
jgi:hypothetical protein